MGKYYDGTIADKHVDWGGDSSTENKPVRGDKVQAFIKSMFEGKIGCLYYDTTNNRYMAFADTEDRDLYLKDPVTYSSYLLGTFDAPFNYTAQITLSTKTYMAVLKGTTGNYIDFTFDTFNKNGQSVGESVTVTFTFIKNGVKQTVSNQYKYGAQVHFNIDDYISVGTNVITVGIIGTTTLAATSVGITWNVIDLSLNHTYNLSRTYSLVSDPSAAAEIPYTLSGSGTKTMEWYLDGAVLPEIKVEDEITESSASRTKYISLANLTQGTHSIQFRAYVTVNGEKFYSDTMYVDAIVLTGTGTDPIITFSAVIPTGNDIIAAGSQLQLYGITQYVSFITSFFVYNPSGAASTQAQISVSGVLQTTLDTVNSKANSFSYRPVAYGQIPLTVVAGTTTRTVLMNVAKSSASIGEITDGLLLALSAVGKSNNSTDKDTWTYGNYTSVFSGFSWTQLSGWTGTALHINAGAKVSTTCQPFSFDFTSTGGTLEFEFATDNVTDESAVLCSIKGSNGAGLAITAAQATLTSAAGSSVSTKFKSGENVRIAFVINKRSGVTDKLLMMLYINGILSGCQPYSSTDNFSNSAYFEIGGTSLADIVLKSVRFYRTALSAEQILNNYILYRDTTDEMLSLYDKNQIYEEGTQNFSVEKLAAQLPVMVFTGDIPTLEATTNKNETIYVDIEYYNYQDTARSFKSTGTRMRPQGTSSMSYPKKNFRIYTNYGKLYDSTGALVSPGVYQFKDKAQPVSTFCLKADYAESSSTHNTSIARLWNQVMYNTQLSNSYLLRTEAQKAALSSSYAYDVRTTIDGFPIVCFYRPTADADLVFMGKYNFNNDKSTESVFGFKNIPGFDNSKMQCWEVLNNGHHLCNFKDVLNFDTEWSDAYESRYPDGGTNTQYLKDVSTWIASTRYSSDVTFSGNINVASELKSDTDTQYGSTSTYAANGSYTDSAANRALKFMKEKWDYLDVYKMAAYYVYFMRFGAVDQVVKNVMFTTEGTQGVGTHCKWFIINYDNDTINGLVNDGPNVVPYDADRQTLDSRFSTATYYFAGHDSTLWNNLEADAEFMRIVSDIDNSLYQAGLTYSGVITMFDVNQMGKWCARVYNQDARYKYIGPYVNDSINNLFMCQGSRQSHRRYWLSHRFDLMDSKLVSGAYKSKTLEFKVANAPLGLGFSITAGSLLYYGYGVNNVVQESGVRLAKGESHTFTTKSILNVGDPVRIYGAVNLQEVDLSSFISYIAQLTMTNVYDSVLGTRLKKLVLGVPSTSTLTNTSLSEISGLSSAQKLEYLDIGGYMGLTDLDLSSLSYFKTLKAFNSGLTSLTLAQGGPVEYLELPASLHNIVLSNLPNLTTANLKFSGYSNIQTLVLDTLPGVDIYNIAKQAYAGGNMTHVRLVGISATDSSLEYLYNLGHLKGIDEAGNALNLAVLSGSIHVTYADEMYYTYLQANFPNLTITYDNYRQTPTITIKVTDTSSNALSGATVTIGTTVLTTGTDGTVTYRTASKFDMTVSYDGYQPNTQTVAVGTVDKTVTVALYKYYNIVFNVVASFGSKLSGCAITIGTETLTTDSTGSVTFKRINGSYSYSAAYMVETIKTGSVSVSNANPSAITLTFEGDIELLKPTANGNIQMLIAVNSNSSGAFPLYITSTDTAYTINWGDGNTTSATGTGTVSYSHTYSSYNVYQVEISGCENITYCSEVSTSYISSYNNGTTNYHTVAYWTIGNSKVSNLTFGGFQYFKYVGSDVFKNDSSRTSFSYAFQYTKITKIPVGLFDNAISALAFVKTFSYSSIMEIPSSLFSNCISVTHFSGCFSSCYNLTSIPENLFKYNVNAIYFDYTFASCYGLTSIPENLFSGCTEVTTFNGCFQNAYNITSIPELLFANNIKVTSFDSVFAQTTPSTIGNGPTNFTENIFKNNVNVKSFAFSFDGVGIVSIPDNLFKYNTNVTSFRGCFYSCKKLTSIPSNLFDNNVNVTDFMSVFSTSSVSSIPDNLFKYNIKVDSFNNAFSASKISSIPENIFQYNTLVTDFTGVFASTLITSIPENLFKFNTSVLYFGASSNSSGATNGAFGSCNSLTSIPDNLFKYNTKATGFVGVFGWCPALKTYPDRLFDIGSTGYLYLSYAFAGATLNRAFISNYLGTQISGSYMFGYGTGNIGYLELESATPPSIQGNEFDGSYPIYVPVSAINTYKTASGWSSYSSRITRPNLTSDITLTVNFKTTDGTTVGTKTYTVAFGTPSYYEITSNDLLTGYKNDTALIDLSTGTTVSYDCTAYPVVTYTVTKHFVDESGNTIQADETESFTVGNGKYNTVIVSSPYSSIVYSSSTLYLNNNSQAITLTGNAEVTFIYKSTLITWSGNWTQYNTSTYGVNSYKSDKIYSNGSTVETMTVAGITTITLSCRTYGGSGYDYLTIGNIDTACNRSTYKYSMAYISSGTSYTDYTFTFPNSGSHYIQFCYSKDGGGNSGDDACYVYVKSYS